MISNPRDTLPANAWSGKGALAGYLVDPSALPVPYDMQGFSFGVFPDIYGNIFLMLADHYDASAWHGDQRSGQRLADKIVFQVAGGVASRPEWDDDGTGGFPGILEGRVVADDPSMDPSRAMWIHDVPFRLSTGRGSWDGLMYATVCPWLRLGYFTRAGGAGIWTDFEGFMSHALAAGLSALSENWGGMIAEVEKQWTFVGDYGSFNSAIDQAVKNAFNAQNKLSQKQKHSQEFYDRWVAGRAPMAGMANPGQATRGPFAQQQQQQAGGVILLAGLLAAVLL